MIKKLLYSLLIFTCAHLAQAEDKKTNVILVMCDDLGWGDVGFNGNQIIQTPHLDEMAASGIRFTRFYAQAPVCSPTRGSCLTGRHPRRYGIDGANSGRLEPSEKNLAEYLREAGYATGHFGKWHLGTLTKTLKESNRGGPRGIAHFAPPWEHGFDRCFSTEAKVPTWDPMWRPKKPETRNKWWNPAPPDDSIPYNTHYWNEKGKTVRDNLEGDDSRVIMDRALPFIEDSVGKKQAFFAVIWFHAPHLPVVAGEKYRQPYQSHSDYHQHYFGCVTALDEQVGRLRAKLRALDVAKDTMIWFCSDNGPEGQAHNAPGTAGLFRGRKRDLYEGGIRVPALLEWPAKFSKKIVRTPVSTSDYLPTICAALNLNPDPEIRLDGINVLPELEKNRRRRGQKKEERPPIGFWQGSREAWIGERYKLVKNKGKKEELFDLINDPGETTDLAADKKELFEKLKGELQGWKETIKHIN